MAKRLFLWAFPLLVGVGLYQLFGFAFPLQASALQTRFQLWKEGVSEVQSAGSLHGYLHDMCSKNPQPGENCSCIALIHGLGDHALTWKRILIWPQNGWRDPVKLFAVDLPGSGQSPAPVQADSYRAREMAKTLKQTLAPICPHWILVGNSLGGWLAAWLALDWPEGVSKLVLLSPAGLRSTGRLSQNRDALTEPTIESLKDFQRRAYYQAKPLPDHVWKAIVESARRSNARAVVNAQTDEDYMDEKLPTLHKPTLVFWGEADQIIPIEKGRGFHSLVPGAIWRSVKNCGHLPQKECPLDVIQAIGDMVKHGVM